MLKKCLVVFAIAGSMSQISMAAPQVITGKDTGLTRAESFCQFKIKDSNYRKHFAIGDDEIQVLLKEDYKNLKYDHGISYASVLKSKCNVDTSEKDFEVTKIMASKTGSIKQEAGYTIIPKDSTMYLFYKLKGV